MLTKKIQMHMLSVINANRLWRFEFDAVRSNESCAALLAVRYIHPSQPGFVLAIGDGSTGQLGLGPDVMEQSKPARVDLPADVIQICAGGMHSVCLTVKGEVSWFALLN